MTLTELFLAQAGDPFRIVLLAGLVYTMHRTRAASGVVIPLLAGILFVAVLIPTTISRGLPAPIQMQVFVGVVVNAIWVAIGMGVRALILSRRG